MTRKQVLTVALTTASVFCALAVVPTFAQTYEPSLGEVARKNRARAKAKHKDAKETKEEVSPRPMSTATVTNYGSSASLGSSSTDSSASAANSEPAPDAKGTADSQSTSEATPQEQPGAAKSESQTKDDRVAQLKKDQESLNQIIDKMKAQLAAETQDSRRQALSEVISNAEQELEKKKQEQSEAERSAPRK